MSNMRTVLSRIIKEMREWRSHAGTPSFRLNEWADQLTTLMPGEPAHRWPFVESPGEFTARLEAAMREFPLLGAVRNVLIENPPALVATTSQSGGAVQGEVAELRNALEHAEGKLRVYSEGAGKHDTEVSCMILPMIRRILTTPPPAPVMNDSPCRWSQQEDGYACFNTGCGHEYTVFGGEDGEVDIPYCPYCARRIEAGAPPAPAAEQGDATCDCSRDHRGQHIYVCPERPLAFGLHDPAAAFSAAPTQPEARGVEGIASSACPICGLDSPHTHTARAVTNWIATQAQRFRNIIGITVGAIERFDLYRDTETGFDCSRMVNSPSGMYVEYADHLEQLLAATPNPVRAEQPKWLDIPPFLRRDATPEEHAAWEAKRAEQLSTELRDLLLVIVDNLQDLPVNEDWAKRAVDRLLRVIDNVPAEQPEGKGAIAWMRRTAVHRAHDAETGTPTGRSDGERIITERKVYPDDIPLYAAPSFEVDGFDEWYANYDGEGGPSNPEQLARDAWFRAAVAPAAPGAAVGVDELCREARELQREHYGHGMGLHLAMIDWAEKYDAALAGKEID